MGDGVMERLTFEGNFCDIAQCRELPCPYNGACSQRKVWERLKAYEDSGLDPEEVLPKDKADEIALKLMRLADFESLCSYDRLRELAEADKDERAVVLPVRPVLTPILSSMLYIIEDGDIYEDALYEAVVGMSENGKMNVVYTTLSDQIIFEQADIGKTVFLTREAAEKALEAMKGG
nr:MAG TPA: hypothetical protein [Caudoviricetes sp.]